MRLLLGITPRSRGPGWSSRKSWLWLSLLLILSTRGVSRAIQKNSSMSGSSTGAHVPPLSTTEKSSFLGEIEEALLCRRRIEAGTRSEREELGRVPGREPGRVPGRVPWRVLGREP